jgi:transcriptional regulator with XRE-family HTH domain
MEVKSVDDFREIVKKEVYDLRISIAELARRADTAQPGLNNFVKGTSGMNMDTMFSLLRVFGIVFDAKKIADGANLESAIMKLYQEPVVVKLNPDFKDKLVQALKEEILSYTKNPDPNKPKFTIELILRLLENAIDKTATI